MVNSPIQNTSLMLIALCLSACASGPLALKPLFPNTPLTVIAPTIKPNENLFVDGIPALPASIIQRVEKYTDFRGHSFVDWHPLRREMLVAHRKGSTTQLFLVKGPMAEPEQITQFPERVSDAMFEPREGKYIVFERSVGGNEADQIYRMDLATRATVQLSNPAERHNMGAWNKAGTVMLFASLPLDKTAQGGTRAEVNTTLNSIDPANPQSLKKIIDLPGGGWYGFRFMPDDKQIYALRYLSATQSEIWLIDPVSAKTTQLLPIGGDATPASYYPVGFVPNTTRLFLSSTRSGEFNELMVFDTATKTLKRLDKPTPWDVGGADISHDGQRLAQVLNVDGASELRILNTTSLKQETSPVLPVGSISSVRFHPNQAELAFALNSAQSPSAVFSYSPTTGALTQWTKAFAPAGVDMTRFGSQKIIRWSSFDGLQISGLLNQPPSNFVGKRPVLIDIHGGPEAQSQVGFMGRYNYLINELGIAVISPNVRGSSGYGKTFLSLDNGYKREDSVKDIGALLDWIAKQPNLDAGRVMVSGGSYGGYMSLASAVFYSDRIVGAIDSVGISNFVTFLESTESYRRDLRRVEYGDERDPAMRAFLNRISPLTNANKIKVPLFVIQGKNDPRVPYTEAEQIVAATRKNGSPVWYLRAENEGHGFARKENADFQFYAMVTFMELYLLGR